jgi:uncharacterized repeat protein (TIGR03847 family)
VKYEFTAPDRVAVGAIGDVGERLFLLQVREGRRIGVIKFEKQQLAAIAEWVTASLDDMGRPAHLPEDLALEPEYEVDMVVSEISVGLDEEARQVHIDGISSDGEDELEVVMSVEWAAALAIAIARLVAAGRPPCPLCGFPLDPRGHDCPRTNGHRPPRR